jgi:hypothetical protein
MTHEHIDAERPFDPANFPALREFFPAYLHQDFGEEYDSAEDAVKGFLSEASGDEILEVKEEWKQFRAAIRSRSLEEIRAALQQLGSAWWPETEGQLKSLDEILTHAEA